MVEYTIEQRKETTIEQYLSLIETFSGCQTFKKQEGEKAYENLIENLREKLIECYKKTQYRNNDEEENIDLNSIKFTVSSPIRLYLMRKQ
jgi:hypothetical protein